MFDSLALVCIDIIDASRKMLAINGMYFLSFLVCFIQWKAEF